MAQSETQAGAEFPNCKHLNSLGKSDPNFPTEEWDFSSIPQGHLDDAIIYEYGRSCEWVVKIFRKWHQQKLPVSEVNGKRSWWSGLTVKEVLERMTHAAEPLEAPELIAIGPPEIDKSPYIEKLYDLNPLFPVPFLKTSFLQKEDVDAENLGLIFPKQQGFRLLEKRFEKLRRNQFVKSSWDNPEFVGRMRKLGVEKFEIVLDLRFSKNRIKAQIRNWIDGLDDKGIAKLPVKKGQAAKPPWFRLKELSALRFFEHRYSRIRAVDYIEKHTAIKGSVEGHKLLPTYRSEGAWWDAVQHAKSYRDKLFPTPR